MKTSILILAAGQSGFETHDGGYPLCLAELEGLSLLERIINNTQNIENARHVFALLSKDAKRFHLDKIAKLLVPSSRVILTPDSTQGSACTALLAASQLEPSNELLIISANELVDVDYSEIVNNFRSRNLKGGLLTFHSVHPRYSYVRLDSQGLVSEAAQQNPISNNATAGVFWFAQTKDFVEATMNMIRKDANVNGLFYVAPTFNELILKQAPVGVVNLNPNRYRPLKSERQVYQFENGGLL